ncbi:hypothetical protein JCM5353_003289 [Sporobolomyces roseus]
MSSSQSYSTLCKVVLRRRMRNMLILAASASYSALFISVFDPKELPGSLFNFLSVLLFAPIAFLGTLPLFVLRKQTISLPQPPLATKFATYSQLRQRSTIRVFLAYWFGATAFHFAFVWCATFTSSDSRLSLFFYHQGRDTWQINERRITLGLLHCFTAAFATGQHVVKDRSQVEFDQDTSLAIPARLLTRSTSILRSSIRSTSITFLSFWTSYVLLRRPILRFILVNFVGPWSRPHLYTMMRHSGSYSFTLALRSIASCFLMFTLWEITHAIFEVYATQPMSVSQFASNPNQSLLSGLRSDEPYYQQFAYLELEILSLTSPSRREAIFKDVKRSSSVGGGAWSELSRECLILIGTELQRAKGRGRIPVTVTGQSSTPIQGSSSSQQRQSSSSNSIDNRASIKSGEIFIPRHPSFFDKLSSVASSSSTSQTPSLPPSLEPYTSQATSALSSAVSSAQSQLTSRIPSILQTSSSSSITSHLPTLIKKEEGGGEKPMKVEDVVRVVGSEDRLARWVPRGMRKNWFEIGPEYRIGKCVQRRRETICAIQALSNLVCASLTEDPYGVVQKDIEKILEGFIRYLNVLESLEREFGIVVAREKEEVFGGGGEVEEYWRRVERDQVEGLRNALRQGVRAILNEFAPYLSEFRFPTSIASQLQVLVDWGG